jgi:hypothetical protein
MNAWTTARCNAMRAKVALNERGKKVATQKI